MSQTILAQSSLSVQSNPVKVHEYALTVINREDDDIQTLIAAFQSLPSTEDWKNWLSGWASCGYALATTPVLIRTI